MFGYERNVEWTVHPEADSEDMKFECIAKTDSSNISREINVVVASEEFYIDENRTNVEVGTDEARASSNTDIEWFQSACQSDLTCTL